MHEEDSTALRILATKMTDRIMEALRSSSHPNPPRVTVMVELAEFLKAMPKAPLEEISAELIGEATAEKLAGPDWREKHDHWE